MKSNHVTRVPLAAKNCISPKQYSSNGDVFIKTDAKNKIRNLFILEMARCHFLKIYLSDVIASFFRNYQLTMACYISN